MADFLFHFFIIEFILLKSGKRFRINIYRIAKLTFPNNETTKANTAE